MTLTGFDVAHPLFAGLGAPAQPIAPDGYWSALERYVGPYLAELLVEKQDAPGLAAAYEFRSADSVHLLLSTGAVTGLIGPGYGWTADGERLFLNAIEWAREVEQAAPAAPELDTDADPVVMASPVTLTGQKEFRSSVRLLRDGEQVATAEPARDGSFSVDVGLHEGSNSFTAVASNYAGGSPPSAPVTVVLDTTGPTLTCTPADHDGFFAPTATLRGTVQDANAGVAELRLNGVPVTVAADGSFSTDAALAEGAEHADPDRPRCGRQRDDREPIGPALPLFDGLAGRRRARRQGERLPPHHRRRRRLGPGRFRRRAAPVRNR